MWSYSWGVVAEEDLRFLAATNSQIMGNREWKLSV
jgi:hypothetical protein